jgi:chromosome segregation ATPase
VLNATDISLIFLGILIVMVLLEVRKLSRKPEPVARLEEHFERLSQQMERIGTPVDLQLPGGAQIVDAHESFETITEQLERLGEETEGLDASMDPDRRSAGDLARIRSDLAALRELIDRTVAGVQQTAAALQGARAAVQRMEARVVGHDADGEAG